MDLGENAENNSPYSITYPLNTTNIGTVLMTKKCMTFINTLKIKIEKKFRNRLIGETNLCFNVHVHINLHN